MEEQIKETTKPEENKTEETVVVETTQTPVVSSGKGKKKIKRQVASGHAYIQATYNNTIISFTDKNGGAITQSSAGQVGFKGPKKSTPYAAGIIVKNAVERAKSWGLKEVFVFVKGVGSGREAAIRALNANGINVTGIKDITPIPHNGCRPPKPRRV